MQEFNVSDEHAGKRLDVFLSSQFPNFTRSTISKLVDDDFYTFIPRDKRVETNLCKMLYFNFDNIMPAQNFLNYLKTNFARFCLSIYKLNMNLHRGELKSVPWLDFTQEWTDEKLYKYFLLTKEEIDFIEKNIPKYY